MSFFTFLHIVIGGGLALLLVVALFSKPAEVSPAEVRKALVDFVEGRGGEWDWDDFISVPIRDPKLDAIRKRCAQLPEEFPPEAQFHYCSERGIQVIREYIQELT